jgi:hypothetical protein
MKRGFAGFLLILVFIALVVLSKSVTAETYQNSVEVTEVRYPTAYTIMPNTNFTVWVTVSWSVSPADVGFLKVLIKTDPWVQSGIAKEYLIGKKELDGKSHSRTIQLPNLLQAPNREGIWPLYAQAQINITTLVLASDPVLFSVSIGNSSTIIPFATPSQETIMMILGIGIVCVLLRYGKHPCKQSHCNQSHWSL